MAAIAVTSVFLFGCASSKFDLSGEKKSPEAALKAAYLHNNFVASFEGAARISVEGPEGAQGFDADVYYKNPDSLMIRIEYLLGADAALLGALGTRFVFYNKVNDNFFSGNIDDDFVDAFFQLPVPISQFTDLLIAKPPLDSAFADYTFSDLQDNYLFETQKNDLTWYYSIDPITARVTLLEIYNSQKELLLSQEFAKFENLKKFSFPRQIILRRPSKGQYISIYYRDFQINKHIPGTTFEINIPASAKQLDLDF